MEGKTPLLVNVKERVERMDENGGREDEGAGAHLPEKIRVVRSPHVGEERVPDQEPLLPHSGEEKAEGAEEDRKHRNRWRATRGYQRNPRLSEVGKVSLDII